MKKSRTLKRNHIAVKQSQTHGYGVFATKKINKGAIIEECYIIISKKGDDKALENYYFDVNKKYAIFTGFGIIYNHADDPNADYTFNLKTRVATITASETIQKGEEIFISYGEEWFSDRGWKSKNRTL